MFASARPSSPSSEVESEDERSPILSTHQPWNRQQVEKINKQRKLYQAVHGLNYVFATTCLIMILGLSTYILEINVTALPTILPFLLLWGGEILVFIMLYNIMKLISRALTNRYQSVAGGFLSWFDSNEAKITLIIFTFKMVVYYFFIHCLLVIAEILLFLSVIGIVNCVYSLIPIMIIFIQALMTSFFTRLNNCLHSISGLLALSYLILFVVSRSIHISSYIMSLPILIFAMLWICILLHVLYLSIFDVVKLKSSQYQAFYLYSGGLLIGLVDLLYWLSTNDNYAVEKDYTILLCFLLISLIMIFSAMCMDMFNYLDYKMRNVGGIPLPLKQDAKGYWVIDRPKLPRNFIILGYLEPGTKFDDAHDDPPTTQSNILCFLIEMISFRRKTKNARHTRRRPLSHSEVSFSSEEGSNSSTSQYHSDSVSS